MAESRRPKRTSRHHVVVELHGSRAREGIDLDALENFIEYFRRALRDFDRQQRGHMVGRGGHPDARDAAATSFRLLRFRTGSGILTLEPVAPAELAATQVDLEEVEYRASATLRGLLDAVESEDGELSPQVLEALTYAVRSIGDDASIGVRKPRQRKRVVIDEQRLEYLRAPREPESVVVSVTGRLHLLEVDEPMRVGVKAPDGVDWSCLYPPELKPVVLGAVEKIVRVEGPGRKLTPLTGRIELHHIEVLPEYPQDEMFTAEAVSAAELRDRQGVAGPQGLAALTDTAWEDDEASERFLEATLGKMAQS